MKSAFSLFSSHLELAHRWWQRLLLPGDSILDATCGRGRDTLMLAQAVLTEKEGLLWALDIQDEAIEATKTRLAAALSEQQFSRVKVEKCDHAILPKALVGVPLKLAVYNLGYLPGGDKTLITTAEGTIRSLESVSMQIVPGGALSIMCYTGHPGGDVESDAVIEWASKLPPSLWNVCCHRWLNVSQAPLWVLCQRDCS